MWSENKLGCESGGVLWTTVMQKVTYLNNYYDNTICKLIISSLVVFVANFMLHNII